MGKPDTEKLKKLSEELRESRKKPQGETVKLPPYVPLKPGQSVVVFTQHKKNQASETTG